MNRILFYFIFCIALASIAFADEPRLDVTTRNIVADFATRTVKYKQAVIDGKQIESLVGETISQPTQQSAAVIDVDTNAPRIRVKCRTARLAKLDDDSWLLTTPGEHWVDVLGLGIVDGKLYFEESEILVKIEGGPEPQPDPDPEPPLPPDPDEPPDPDDPDAPPIPLDGFRVLLIHETSELPRLPESQREIFYGVQVRSFLNETCVIDGGRPAWRILDDDTMFVDANSSWLHAMRRPRGQLPWLIVSNGKTGYEGPLPANVNSTLDLLRKYVPGQ